MVEAAVTIIPMFAMFIGMVDVSLVVFLQSTLTHATREAARFAITFGSTYNGASCASSQAKCIVQAVQTNGFGFLSGTKGNLVAVNYYTANDLSNPVMVCNSTSCTLRGTLPQTLSNGKVVNYANQPGNVVEVAVSNYPWTWLLPISAKGYGATPTSISLGSSSMDVLGGLAVGTTVPPAP
jgi:Flp pilus assembly protein TadG